MIKKEFMRDVVEWDVENWSRAIGFWENDISKIGSLAEKKVLDIGGRNGGLSLYWALKGAKVICSDRNEDGFDNAKKLHKKYKVTDKVLYEVIDATMLPYTEEFDIISFKSVLGGIGYHQNIENQKQMIKCIHKALKKGGMCFFVENLAASPLHQIIRKYLVKWGQDWRYIKLSEIMELTKDFSEVRYQPFGFWGVFGRNYTMSKVLGKIDASLENIINDDHKYIVSCILKK